MDEGPALLQVEYLDRSYLDGSAPAGDDPQSAMELELTPYAQEYYDQAVKAYGPGIRADAALLVARSMRRYGYTPQALNAFDLQQRQKNRGTSGY